MSHFFCPMSHSPDASNSGSFPSLFVFDLYWNTIVFHFQNYISRMIDNTNQVMYRWTIVCLCSTLFLPGNLAFQLQEFPTHSFGRDARPFQRNPPVRRGWWPGHCLHHDQHRRDHRLEASPSSSAEFEWQELRATLSTMQANQIRSRDMDPMIRRTVEGYVQTIVRQRPSPIPLSEIATKLPNTQWDLAFTTDPIMIQALPADASLRLEFDQDKTTARVNYCLEFGKKTWGLKRLVAESTYTCGKDGVVSIIYDKIKTDLFSLQNLGVPFNGLLQGRATYVTTTYFDGSYWIETGTGSSGEEYFTVYVRSDE